VLERGFAPWDDIVFWMGAKEVLTGLATKPDLMHRLIRRLTDAYLEGLAQFERLNLIALNTCNERVGSGAYGHTARLPQADFDENRIHQEFGIDYEMEWLKKFGMTYYGCCEPLHDRIRELRAIPNLRKISLSPWADVRRRPGNRPRLCDLPEAQSIGSGRSGLASREGPGRTRNQAGSGRGLQCRNRPEQHQHRSATTAAVVAMDAGGNGGRLAPGEALTITAAGRGSPRATQSCSRCRPV
jgi:hypothetical protein